VPWCDDCDRLVEDDQLTEEGNCPDCGVLLTGKRHIPWGFKFMIVASVIYIGYRIYQGISWLAHHA
jgi:hypothetical protein